MNNKKGVTVGWDMIVIIVLSLVGLIIIGLLIMKFTQGGAAALDGWSLFG